MLDIVFNNNSLVLSGSYKRNWLEIDMQAFMKIWYHIEYFSSFLEQRQQTFMCSKFVQVFFIFYFNHRLKV